MPRLVWDRTGERLYETGVDRGVLYPRASNGGYAAGVPWNGLVSITESPSGAEPNPQYADNIKYLNLISAEEFGGTIECFTYPDEWSECDGTAVPVDGVAVGQQDRKTFGLSFRTLVGNDVEGTSHGYKIHIVYGGLASTSDSAYNTVNDSPEAITFSYEFSTTPEPITVLDLKPTASIVVDSTKVSESALAALENRLWGSTGESDDASLPLPDEVLTILGVEPDVSGQGMGGQSLDGIQVISTNEGSDA